MKRLILLLLAGGVGLEASTLTLEQARELALKNHPDVISAELEVSTAEELVKEAKSAYYPSANGYVTGVEAANRSTSLLAGSLSNSSVYSRVAEGVAVNAVLTDFGHTKNLVGESKALRSAAGQGERLSRSQVLLAVDTAYYALLRADAVLKVAQDTLKVRALIAERVGALASNQLKSSLDVSFAEVGKSQAELLLERAEGDSASAEATLSAAMGEAEPTHYDLMDPPDAEQPLGSEGNLSDTALSRRPDVLQLKFQVDAAQHAARAERDASYPTLSAIGVAGASPTHDDRLPNNYAAGGIQLSVPLFAGGMYVAREKAADLKAQQAEQALRLKEDEVARDVRIAWIEATTAQRQITLARQLLENSAQAYRLAKARYDAGTTSILELDEAQLAQTSAAIELADDRYGALTQRSVLRYVTGDVP